MDPDPEDAGLPGPQLVVMGVAGCGKSTLAEALGKAWGLPVIEGDDFHPSRNRELMQRGIALTDADRWGWLDAVGAALQQRRGGAVASCSALKRIYRDRLRAAVPGLSFVFLELDEAAAAARVAARAGSHFFNPDLVRSQFDTLEAPHGEAGVLCVDATLSLDELTQAALDWWSRAATSPIQPPHGDQP